MAAILEVADLEVGFGARTVIRGLHFALAEGDCLSILGPNGSGKTVLLQALLGLIPYRGRVTWRGDARLGYVPQKVAADRQLPLRTRDVLQAKLRYLKLPETELERAAEEVGLTGEMLDGALGTLSGGQLQKALIGLALIGRPNVLLCDEPTASLDELSEEHVYELLHHLNLEHAMTVVLVSHDISVVTRYANQVLCLSQGGSCMGPPSAVLTEATLTGVFGGVSPKFYRHEHEHGH